MHRLDIGHRADTHFSTAGAVCFVDSCSSEDHASGREIRSFYDLEQFLNIGAAVLFYLVIDDLYHGIYDFAQIMRRYVGCHTYGDTCCSVYQKIRKARRKYDRLFLRLIKVWHEIHGIFVDVRKHFHGNLTETRLCVSHGSGSVAIDRTKVSMTVYKRISRRPVLCHIYECSVNRAVTVRVIFTHGITDDTGAFSMWLIRTVVQFYHGIQHSSLYRLQTVSYIRQRAGRDNAHGVINVRGFHCFL